MARGAFAGQDGFGYRLAHGAAELDAALDGAVAAVIVDVLRFSTCVSVATARGAQVLPHPWGAHAAAEAFARQHGAELAGDRDDPAVRWSLSPTDLLRIEAGTRLVLPSPNGAHLSLLAGQRCPMVLAGCLRNARAVGAAVARGGPLGPVVVCAAGEQGAAAVEDVLGAGAVLHHALAAGGARLGAASPEARLAVAAFRAAHDLPGWLLGSISGRELAARGWADDVRTAAALDHDDVVPRLVHGAYRADAAP